MNYKSDWILFDAGIFIGALLKGDTRHNEAYTIVEDARNGIIAACTTASILSEVYAALTWIHANPQHQPSEAAEAVRLLVEPPSSIHVLEDGIDVSLKMLELSKKYNLTARRVHDAKHAATAIVQGITQIYTYDINDWKLFREEGLSIVGPNSSISQIISK